MMTADRNSETPDRDHHYWMGILMMLVSKQTIKLFSLLTVVLVKLNLQEKLRWRDDGEGETLSRSK